MTYNIRENDYTAWLIECNSMCLGITEEGIRWIPFTDESVFTLASKTEREASALLRIIRKSGVIIFPDEMFVSEHGWYRGTL